MISEIGLIFLILTFVISSFSFFNLLFVHKKNKNTFFDELKFSKLAFFLQQHPLYAYHIHF